jgi:hypothetical protein
MDSQTPLIPSSITHDKTEADIVYERTMDMLHAVMLTIFTITFLFTAACYINSLPARYLGFLVDCDVHYLLNL